MVMCLFIYLFIYLFLGVLGLRFCARAFSSCGERGPLFIAVRGPLHCCGLSLLRSIGSRRAGSVVVAHGPSCSAVCGIFPDQGSNPCSLRWQADSQPLRHQGSPGNVFMISVSTCPWSVYRNAIDLYMLILYAVILMSSFISSRITSFFCFCLGLVWLGFGGRFLSIFFIGNHVCCKLSFIFSFQPVCILFLFRILLQWQKLLVLYQVRVMKLTFLSVLILRRGGISLSPVV